MQLCTPEHTKLRHNWEDNWKEHYTSQSWLPWSASSLLFWPFNTLIGSRWLLQELNLQTSTVHSMPTSMLPSKSFRSHTPIWNNSPSCRPLVWRLTGASQGILSAHTTKPTPNNGIQYCIIKQMPTPWIHFPLDAILILPSTLMDVGSYRKSWKSLPRVAKQSRKQRDCRLLCRKSMEYGSFRVTHEHQKPSQKLPYGATPTTIWSGPQYCVTCNCFASCPLDAVRGQSQCPSLRRIGELKQ